MRYGKPTIAFFIFAAIVKRRQLTRKGWAREAGVSLQTISGWIKTLHDAGMIRPCGKELRGHGQRAIIWEWTDKVT